MPAVELQEPPRRRSQTYKLACAPVSDERPETQMPEDAMFAAAASLDAMPFVGEPYGISRVMYLKHLLGENPFSPQFLQSLVSSSPKKELTGKELLRSSLKGKKPKQLAFDETEKHPERPSVNPDREQNPCSYLTNDIERQSWNTQSKISHRVAVVKAELVVQIVGDTLVNHWC